MKPDDILNLCKEALLVGLLSSLPYILLSLVIGVFIAIFSAVTQIQEQTLSFAPKMIFIYLCLLFFSAPLGKLILTFTKKCFTWNIS